MRNIIEIRRRLFRNIYTSIAIRYTFRKNRKSQLPVICNTYPRTGYSRCINSLPNTCSIFLRVSPYILPFVTQNSRMNYTSYINFLSRFMKSKIFTRKKKNKKKTKKKWTQLARQGWEKPTWKNTRSVDLRSKVAETPSPRIPADRGMTVRNQFNSVVYLTRWSIRDEWARKQGTERM